MNINICCPTLKRYDLLKELIESVRASDLLPASINVIDNGGGWMVDAKREFVDDHGIVHRYWKPTGNLGLAASWNWFMENVPEMRVVVNDDLTFYPDTLRLLLNAYAEDTVLFPAGIAATNVFSCFVMSNYLHNAIGGFDESISPKYGYFEDNDAARRLLSAGFSIRGVPDCSVLHAVSSTLKAYTEDEMQEHHRKFQIAQANYVRKWNGLPGEEKWVTPYGRNG